MTMITPGTPEATALGARMLARELAFELNTGMKYGRNYNPLKTAKSLGFKGRTKLQALVWVIEAYGILPDKGDTIDRALKANGMRVETA